MTRPILSALCVPVTVVSRWSTRKRNNDQRHQDITQCFSFSRFSQEQTSLLIWSSHFPFRGKCTITSYITPQRAIDVAPHSGCRWAGRLHVSSRQKSPSSRLCLFYSCCFVILPCLLDDFCSTPSLHTFHLTGRDALKGESLSSFPARADRTPFVFVIINMVTQQQQKESALAPLAYRKL